MKQPWQMPKTPFNNNQQRTQKQMEQLRRQQMGYAWEQDQKKKTFSKKFGSLSPSWGQMNLKKYWNKGHFSFLSVEIQARRIKNNLEKGLITKQKFEQEQNKLFTHDRQGQRWMLSLTNDSWYRYDGKQWVSDIPPGYESCKARFHGFNLES